jgi:hypothetical protein
VIVHNLRTALDYLICQAVLFNGTTVTRQTGFPIVESANSFEDALARQIKGTSQYVERLVRWLEAYYGGREPF